jgi:hypothetical protein
MTSKFGVGPFGETLYSAGTPIELSGTMSVNVEFGAALSNSMVMAGSMSVGVSFSGEHISGDLSVSGEIPVVISLSPAPMFSGKLWQGDVLCGNQWGPDSLCVDPGWVEDPDVDFDVDPDEDMDIPTGPIWKPAEPCNG